MIRAIVSSAGMSLRNRPLQETEEAKKIKSSSKPFHSWKRVRAYIDGEVELDPACEATLKEIIEFAFC